MNPSRQMANPRVAVRRNTGDLSALLPSMARFGAKYAIILVPFFATFPYAFSDATSSPSVYPALILVLSAALLGLAGRNGAKFRVPTGVMLMLAFLLWVFVVGVQDLFSNPQGILKNYLLHAFAVGIAVGTHYVYAHGADKPRNAVRYIRLAGWIVLSYAVLETLGYFSGIPFFFNVLSVIDPLTHSLQQIGFEPNSWRVGFQHSQRVRGFAMEPSFLSPVVAFVFPWFLISMIRRPSITRISIVMIFLGTMYFSYSRAIYLVISVEILIVTLMLFFSRVANAGQRMAISVILGLLFVGMVVYGGLQLMASALEFTDTSYSNTMRYFSAKAAWDAGVDNPFLGLGLVAKTDDLYPYYDAAVFRVRVASFWIAQKFGSEFVSFTLQGGLVARTGLVGVGLFNAVWFYLFWKNWRAFKQRSATLGHPDFYSLGLLAALLGVFMSTFALGPLLVYPYWLIWGLASANLVPTITSGAVER